VLPLAQPSAQPNGTSVVSAVYAQLTAECRWACLDMSFPLIIAPSHGGSGLRLIHASLGPSKTITQMASGSVQPFLGCIAILRTSIRPVVTDGVAWSVGLSVTPVSPAKMAEPIETPFGLRTWVGPGNNVLDGGSDPSWEGAILRGKGRSILKYRDTLWSSVQKR